MKRGVKIPVDIKGNTFLLSRKEYAFYNILKEAKGDLVLIGKIKTELDCDENYIRFIKNSLLRTVANSVEIVNDYGTGYRLIEE